MIKKHVYMYLYNPSHKHNDNSIENKNIYLSVSLSTFLSCSVVVKQSFIPLRENRTYNRTVYSLQSNVSIATPRRPHII